MWDDHTVAWEVRFPWWHTKTFGGRKHRFFAPFITVWHVDPKGDRGWPCGRDDRRRLWRFHVNHWELQVHPWQDFKRWAFERCAVCKLGYPWGYAPVRHGQGNVHHDCSRMIHYREQNEQLREVVRAAINGYCRTADMEPKEAIDVLIPGRGGQLPEWRTHYLARSVMGVTTTDAETVA